MICFNLVCWPFSDASNGMFGIFSAIMEDKCWLVLMV